MTINEISSAILNNLVSGLKGVANVAYSEQQIQAEIVLEWNKIVMQLPNEMAIRQSGLAQKISCIPVECKDISICCPSGRSELWFQIPKLSHLLNGRSVLNASSIDYSVQIKVYYNAEDIRYHKYNRITSKSPYMWIDESLNEQGYHNVWLFNTKMKKVTMDVIPANPLDVISCSDKCNYEVEPKFPAPDWMISDIILNLTNKYMNFYKKGLPNTIVSPNTQKATT